MAANFWITGVEVIQAVQTPDNSVPLIGHKPTFVRVYIQAESATAVWGKLRVNSPAGFTRELMPINSSIRTTVHGHPAITATVNGSQREQWDDSLNYRLPDELTAPGAVDLTAIVFSADNGPENLPPASHFQGLPLNFSERIDLHIYGVVWAVTNMNDGNGAPIGPAAPWSDFEGHRQFVENVLPVSSLTIHPIPGIGRQAPIPQTFGNLVESREWATNKLAELPTGCIINLLDNWDTGGLHGYAWGKACEEQNARDDRIGRVMAQELSHCLGLWWHTFEQGSPYPRPDGKIGSNEIGLDLRGAEPTLVVGSASRPVYDIMSYEERTWSSVFTYLALLEAIKNSAPCLPGFVPWFDLGSPELINFPPEAPIAAVSTRPGSTSLFVIGPTEPGMPGGKVFSKYYPDANHPNQWSDWFSLDDNVFPPGSRIAALSLSEGATSLYVMGVDGEVWTDYFPSNGLPQWSGWQPLGKRQLGRPELINFPPEAPVAAVSTRPGSTSLFVVGPYGRIYSSYFDPSD